MWKKLTARFVAVVVLLSAGASVTAAEPVVHQPRGKALKDNQLYHVKYSCSSNPDVLRQFLSAERRRLGRMLGFSTATHIFAVTVDGVNLAADPLDKAVANFVPQHVFTIDGSNLKYQRGSSCSGQFLVYGLDKPKIAYALKYDKYALPGPAVGLLTFVREIVAPTYRLIRGKDLHPSDEEAVTQVGTIITKYKDYLNFFKDEDASTVAVADLKTGTNRLVVNTIIRGKSVIASEVSIEVKAVDSALLSSLPFRAGFDKYVKINIPADLANIKKVCGDAEDDILNSGFKSPIDIAYIIYRSFKFDTKKKYIECLGPDNLAQFVLNQRGLYEGSIPNSRLINRKDVEDYVFEQNKPSIEAAWTAQVEKMINNLTWLLARFGATDNIPESDIAALSEIVAPTIVLEDQTRKSVISDRTADGKIGAVITEGAFLQQFGRLKEKGFVDFSCYQLTSEPTVRGFDGASAVLLIGKISTKPSEDLKGETRALRLFVEGKVIKKIVVSDQYVEEVRAKNAKCKL